MTRDDLRVWLFLACVYLVGCLVLAVAARLERRWRTRRILGRKVT